MKERVTISDVANAVGYGTTTVSLALRNHAKVPEKTRKIIRDAAQAMGYQRDPMLSALVAYRSQKRSKRAWQGQLVALSTNRIYPWRANVFWANILKSMHHTAREMGYTLHEYSIDTEDISPQRHNKILLSRGVSGLILQPSPRLDESQFDWSTFSVLSFGYNPDRMFHTVTTDNFRAMTVSIDRAIKRGYRRIGLSMSSSLLNPRHYREVGALLAQKALDPSAQLIFFPNRRNSHVDIEKWLRERRIEVLISRHSEQPFVGTQDVKLIDINLEKMGSQTTGIYHPPQVIGAAMIHQIHGIIQRGEKGIPEIPHSIHVGGIWNEGKTLPARSNRS